MISVAATYFTFVLVWITLERKALEIVELKRLLTVVIDNTFVGSRSVEGAKVEFKVMIEVSCASVVLARYLVKAL